MCNTGYCEYERHNEGGCTRPDDPPCRTRDTMTLDRTTRRERHEMYMKHSGGVMCRHCGARADTLELFDEKHQGRPCIYTHTPMAPTAVVAAKFGANDWLYFIKETQLWGDCPGYWKARKLTTATLKALWDSYDGVETSDPEIGGEEVHCLLNARGEGLYCAV